MRVNLLHCSPTQGQCSGWFSLRRLIAFCIGVLTAHLLSAAPAQCQLLQALTGNQTHPMPNSKIWGKKSFADITMPLHFSARVKPTLLVIGRDHPNGTRFLAMFPGIGVNLPLDFGKDFAGLDEFGDLNKGYFVQVAEHDFDHDGIPELIIAIGNGSTDLGVNIIKYHPPQLQKDAGREQNWSLVGKLSGQELARVSGDTIELPYGSQGLYDEYTWVKGKFVKTN